jgi:hypothetical protein
LGLGNAIQKINTRHLGRQQLIKIRRTLMSIIAVILGTILFFVGYIWGIIAAFRSGSAPGCFAILFPVFVPGILALQKKIRWAPTGFAIGGMALIGMSVFLLGADLSILSALSSR